MGYIPRPPIIRIAGLSSFVEVAAGAGAATVLSAALSAIAAPVVISRTGLLLEKAGSGPKFIWSFN